MWCSIPCAGRQFQKSHRLGCQHQHVAAAAHRYMKIVAPSFTLRRLFLLLLLYNDMFAIQANMLGTFIFSLDSPLGSRPADGLTSSPPLLANRSCSQSNDSGEDYHLVMHCVNNSNPLARSRGLIINPSVAENKGAGSQAICV